MKNNLNSDLYIDYFIKKNNIEKNYMEYDDKLNNFSSKVEKWLSKIKVEDQEAFGHLLKNYTYMTRINVRDSLYQQYQEYKEVEPTYEDTIFLPVSSYGGIYNGAINILESFEAAIEDQSEVTKKKIAIDPRTFFNSFDIQHIKNIVFLDDIIGSGETFTDFLIRISLELPELIEEKKLYLFSLINLEKGIQHLKDFSTDHEWEVNIINQKVKKSIFEDPLFYEDSETKNEHKKIIKNYENILVDNVKENEIYVMGYKKSSLLVSFYYNTPNNTLSVFWKGIENQWFPIFKRKEDEHQFLLKDKSVLEEIKDIKLRKIKRKEFFIEQRKKNRRQQ